MDRGELQKYRQPTDLEPVRRGMAQLPASHVLVFGVVALATLAVIALTAAVVAVSVAVVAVALRPYFRRR